MFCAGARIANKCWTPTAPIRNELQYLKVNPNYTVDVVVARLESVVVREIKKGGTAATIKAALDCTIDQLHHETSQPRERVQAAVVKAIERGTRVSGIVLGKNAAQASLTGCYKPARSSSETTTFSASKISRAISLAAWE